ncbi:DUF742 domain-containing protein [Streptomyces spongiae]|uniref:DUF742 domain-containing protein n=1 Tax=Streptomyces spongiae TaxID=565072 RepID=A0A5N8XAP2_9ACTN|nr:DUF742 domain-containing protein [Streptomyces spongiae]
MPAARHDRRDGVSAGQSACASLRHRRWPLSAKPQHPHADHHGEGPPHGQAPRGPQWEHHRAPALCGIPRAVAETAAHLDLPVALTKILLSDRWTKE